VENEILKRLTRRRRRLVNEKARVLNNMQGDLQAVCPGLLEITGGAGNLWFLRFLTSADSLTKLARLHRGTLLKIAGVGVNYATKIQSWQKRAHFSHEAALVGEMIQEDAFRILGKTRGGQARFNGEAAEVLQRQGDWHLRSQSPSSSLTDGLMRLLSLFPHFGQFGRSQWRIDILSPVSHPRNR
jgi:hypothetical protein